MIRRAHTTLRSSNVAIRHAELPTHWQILHPKNMSIVASLPTIVERFWLILVALGARSALLSSPFGVIRYRLQVPPSTAANAHVHV